MKHYIQIEVPEPPKGATHYNPRYSLPFEKKEAGELFIWIDRKKEWDRVEGDVHRKGGSPILTSE